MKKFKPRHIIAILAVFILVLGSYTGWQVFNGKRIAKQYMNEVHKTTQRFDQASSSTNSQLPPNESTSDTSSSRNSTSNTSTQNPASQTADSPTTKNVSSSYRELMSDTYQQTLQAMQSVKNNTLALQKKNITLDAYKVCILQAKATFSSAETFVQANPPPEEKLNISYREFLTGIGLAKDATNVVLEGISSLNLSSLFAAYEMGQNAKQQVLKAYAHF
ncbi:MAG: hypothetical protein PHZ11_08235 [Desulfitobacteriaceae bacterium]|nr:hypothetical protein [Desulfitobacteriaceae bacterium]MDD4346856.1 hypothetical protein [Desulfitobacteriaceae bacterium]MDD4402245.1 hypothetical protein [Desulfitobacteriaceae bacterium]